MKTDEEQWWYDLKIKQMEKDAGIEPTPSAPITLELPSMEDLIAGDRS